jgi:hypothetical protein
MDIVTWLQSKRVLVGVLVLALVAQMPHAQEVFYEMGRDHGWFGWVQSWFAAVALEVAVLVFVVRSNVRVSWAFAAFSIAVNLMYYYDALTPFVAPVLLAAGLPIAIALYSHEVAHEEGKSAHVEQPTAQPSRDAVQEVQADVQPIVQAMQVVQEVDASAEDAVQGDWVGYAMQLRKAGRTFKEIASEVDKHESTVSRRLNGVHA